ncbi:ankyrin repeat domain-containing protein [Frankia sp. Cpl3]|uniref:ankyrin repeat domain-containing protein n=1 Tax=Parafrankia colletiae TaxID=573497 RepID=UPI000E2F2CCF|nr:ankyrin repeat domain-containing protein [Parafrankia colletiae]MCK9902619.1 ankyrin repeat domain-containing protein [Frankia sp. Cpl3]
MSAPSRGAAGDPFAALSTTLTAALTTGTREAFTALLTEDVRWGGEHGGNECTSREQAGDHYAGLLAAGITLQLAELGTAPNGEAAQVTARLQIRSPDGDEFPPQITIRLTLRDGLIADIRELDPLPTVEVLYFDGCPNHEAFLPHLTALLAEHHITAPVTLVRVRDDEDAQAHHFLGSPTVRVNGQDVDPAAERQAHVTKDAASRYGMQCRVYRTPDGTVGAPPDEWIIEALIGDPAHDAAVDAIHSGDVPALQRLLTENPRLASIRLQRHGDRTLLHVATDWPGHFPNVAATLTALVAAGADPNTGAVGEHPETPLHWAASSDDVAAIDALLDNGADIDAPGAVVAGGTPMADATAFGQWDAARRLLERGAGTNLFEAAALGLVAEVHRHLHTSQPAAEDITSSSWGACHGGHVATAAMLLDHGADINWAGYDDLTPLDTARRSEAADVVEWLEQHGGTSAQHSA